MYMRESKVYRECIGDAFLSYEMTYDKDENQKNIITKHIGMLYVICFG